MTRPRILVLPRVRGKAPWGLGPRGVPEATLEAIAYLIARGRYEASSFRGSERDADAASAWGFRVVESLVGVLE